MKPFLYGLLLVSCLLLVLWARPIITNAEGAPATATALAATRPKQCEPGKTSPEAMGWRWRQNTPVRVYYLKDNFSVAETEALSRAVNNWNSALQEIDSQIVFIIGGESEIVAGDHASITIKRGIPRVQKRVGETRFHLMANGMARLTVTINPVVTNLDALTSLMTHELGHSLGLADCYECRRGTTAMSAFKGDNKGNDVYAPSACDKYAVAVAYASQTGTQARIIPSEQE
jgi:Dual-action HEIGH metallo-peptidase